MYRLFYTMIGIIIVLFQLAIFLHLQNILYNMKVALIFIGYALIFIIASKFKRFFPTPPTHQYLRLFATGVFATSVSYSMSIVLITLGFGHFGYLWEICILGAFVPIIAFLFKL